MKETRTLKTFQKSPRDPQGLLDYRGLFLYQIIDLWKCEPSGIKVSDILREAEILKLIDFKF